MSKNKSQANRKSELALAYAKLAQKTGKLPSKAEMKKAGLTTDMMRHHFGDMKTLREFSKEQSPEMFEDIMSPDLYTPKVFDDLKERSKKYKRFFITTAVGGAPVNEKFLSSIKNYSKLNKAMVLVIPANYALMDLDPKLASDLDINILFKKLKINSNLYVDPIKIDPKQVDPVAGLDSMGVTDGTVIIGSPKQRRVPVANSNTKLARILQSTGAITRPRYVPADRIPKRRDTLAEFHHVMGGVIVEVKDDKYYHFRVVQMCKDGTFNDLFYNYGAEGTAPKFVGCEAIVQGDYHVGDTDPAVDAAVDEMCRIGRPRYRIFHDFFDGTSINHHEMDNKVLRAIQAGENKIDLKKEMLAAKAAVESKLKQGTAKKLVFVKSNHDKFLDRYLSKGFFDDHNRLFATELQVMAMKKLDPLKAGLESLGLVLDERVVWLERDQDFRVAGVECGAHGDLGSNGKRNPGSKGMYKAYGKVFYGHCHYGEMNHGAWSVGTSTHRKLGYNEGASSWDNSQGIVYADGTRQLINVIDGKWRL